MSRFTVRSTSRRSSRTPFCGICKKAGKTQQEFTSHFVKNAPNGEVVCPTLLSTECRYCHDFGHTKAHCPKLLEKASRQAFHGKQQRASDKKRKAENRLRAQVEAAQAEKGNTFLEMSFGRTSIRMPIKCQPVSKKARNTVSVDSSFANAFYSDSDSDDEEAVMNHGPAVAQPRQLIGAWGNGAAAIAQPAIAQPAIASKPQSWKKPKRVTFKHDNAETLMKPIAAETRTYLKGSPTNAFVEKPKTPVLKTSTNAWKPRSRTASVSSYDTALQCDEELRTSASGRTVGQIEASIKEVQEELDDCDHSSTNWSDKGDIEDLQDKLSELEDELKSIVGLDQFGRPTADNSAW
jgi:hypothetical protein